MTLPAQRGLDRLPGSVAAAVVEFLVDPLISAPRKVGKELRGHLEGTWSTRRGPYRVVYLINDDAHRVEVLRIAHRADMYRRG